MFNTFLPPTNTLEFAHCDELNDVLTKADSIPSDIVNVQ